MGGKSEELVNVDLQWEVSIWIGPNPVRNQNWFTGNEWTDNWIVKHIPVIVMVQVFPFLDRLEAVQHTLQRVQADKAVAIQWFRCVIWTFTSLDELFKLWSNELWFIIMQKNMKTKDNKEDEMNWRWTKDQQKLITCYRFMFY